MSEYIYDPTADAERLKKKQMLAKLLRAQAMQKYAPLHDAGAFKVANWGDAISSVADTWAASRAEKDLAKEEESTFRDQATYRNQKTADYTRLRHGVPTYFGDDTRGLDETGGDAAQPVVETAGRDPRKALALAMMSNMPDLQKQAKEDQDADLKMLTVPGASVASRKQAWLTGDAGVLQEEPKEHVVDGKLVRGGQVVGDFQDRYGAPGTIPNTKIPGQQNLSTQKWDTLNAGGTTVNVGDRQALPIMFNQAKEIQASTREAERRLVSNKDALGLVDNAHTGLGADAILLGHRVGKAFNLTDDAIGRIRDSQSLLRELAPNVLASLKALRPASDTDLKWSKEVQLADLSSDPRAMKRALRIIASEDATKIAQGRRDWQSMVSAYPDQAQAFKVFEPAQLGQVSDFNLDYDESRMLFTPKYAPGELPPEKTPAAPPTAAPTAPSAASGLTPAEQKELEELRKRFGGSK